MTDKEPDPVLEKSEEESEQPTTTTTKTASAELISSTTTNNEDSPPDDGVGECDPTIIDSEAGSSCGSDRDQPREDNASDHDYGKNIESDDDGGKKNEAEEESDRKYESADDAMSADDGISDGLSDGLSDDCSNSSSGSERSSKEKKKKSNRCHVCRKKVGLTGFVCRCGGLYCSLHRYSDKHSCSFNYREQGAEEIRKNNPQTVAPKITKI